MKDVQPPYSLTLPAPPSPQPRPRHRTLRKANMNASKTALPLILPPPPPLHVPPRNLSIRSGMKIPSSPSGEPSDSAPPAAFSPLSQSNHYLTPRTFRFLPFRCLFCAPTKKVQVPPLLREVPFDGPVETFLPKNEDQPV